MNETTLTPEDYEKAVVEFLRREGNGLENLEVTHRETHFEPAIHAESPYEIDATVRFRCLGLDFVLLVECKHLRRKVERKVVNELADKVRRLVAQRGVIFSVSGFESGAIEAALTSNIALVRFVENEPEYHVRSLTPVAVPTVHGFWQVSLDEGRESMFNLRLNPGRLGKALTEKAQ